MTLLILTYQHLMITTQIINLRRDRIWRKAPSKVTEEYCRSFGLRIGNGRIGDDEKFGKFTCINKKVPVQ